MARLIALTLAFALSLAGGAAQAEPNFPERGTAPVVDAANVIDDADEALLSAKLDAFEEANQRQFVVATVPSLDGYEISDYGYQLGRHWQLGDAEDDDGIILLVAPNERKVRIEVGYGLEDVVPDGLAYDIIERDILPRFKAGDMTGGIVAGADAIVTQIELPPEQQRAAIAAVERQPREDGEFPVGLIIWGAMIFFFFILPMIRGRRRGRRYGAGDTIRDVIVWNAINSAMRGGSGRSSGGWGGGGFGGGGGGFSGGGGSFGGGGASGSW